MPAHRTPVRRGADIDLPSTTVTSAPARGAARRAAAVAGIVAILGAGACSATTSTGTGETASDASSVSGAPASVAAASTASDAGAGAALLSANVDAPDVDDGAWSVDDAVAIELTGAGAEVASSAVVADGSTVTITAPGTYVVSGTLDDGQLVVDSAADGTVRVVLDGATIHSSTTAALAVADADDAVVVLAEGSSNTLSDSERADAGERAAAGDDVDVPNAALFSMADLTIAGSGALQVTGAEADGIASKDGLTIAGGTIEIDAADDAVRGKDVVAIAGGSVTARAGGDGISADNDTDADAGYVWISGGTVAIDAGADGIDAATDAVLSGGDVTVAAADDAVHTEVAIAVDGGTVEVTEAYEGVDSAAIALTGGTVALHTADDAVNVVGGDLVISGGDLAVDSGGDGIDVNGSVTMQGGTLVVDGPSQQNNGALDYDGTWTQTGGSLVATGSAGMLAAPGTSSSQSSLVATFAAQPAGSTVRVFGADGTELLAVSPTKSYASIVVSVPGLVDGEDYSVTVDGTTVATTTTADAATVAASGRRGPGGGARPGG
ncbi:MAG: carbohydrate-binding domain-containing protein [Acidimicrobiales bacterium]|nr:carbohydrate-binding domain-containing protein [Acidimicrobiales bacterium]